MSQLTVTATPLRAPRRGSTVAPLRVMPRRIAATGHGAFATFCLVLLTVGLIGLLLLNTALAQGSLAVGTLQRQSAVLANNAADLNQQIAAASSSAALAGKASAMGMVRSNERAYLDLSTGAVTGTAYPATSNQALTIVTRATPPPPVSAAEKKRLAAATAAVLAATEPLGSAAVETGPTSTSEQAAQKKEAKSKTAKNSKKKASSKKSASEATTTVAPDNDAKKP